MTFRLLVCAAAVAAPLVASAGPEHHDHPAPAKINNPQFDRIKALAGDWTAAPGSKMPVKINYRVVSNGSAVMETMDSGTDHEMITMYHVNGDSLMMTHYCAANNQPRMQAQPSSGSGKTIAFAFKDATNLPKPTDMHMSKLSLTMPDDKHLTEEWTSVNGGKEEKVQFDLVRAGK